MKVFEKNTLNSFLEKRLSEAESKVYLKNGKNSDEEIEQLIFDEFKLPIPERDLSKSPETNIIESSQCIDYPLLDGGNPLWDYNPGFPQSSSYAKPTAKKYHDPEKGSFLRLSVEVHQDPRWTQGVFEDLKLSSI